MGNVVGVKKKKAKIMKIDGQTIKLKLPAMAIDVLTDYPSGHVLLEFESVKKYGIRAPRLRPEDEIKPGKIYFLVDMPKFPEPVVRTRSLAHVGSAQERLERLMVMRNSVSDLGSGPGRVRVKMRVSRAQMEKLMEESKDETEVAERIIDLCLKTSEGLSY